MSEEKKESTKVLTNEVVTPVNAPADGRFESAGLDVVGGDYKGSRVRRWEVYQANTIRLGLKNRLNVISAEDLEAMSGDDPIAVGVVSNWVQTCLVGPQMRAAAKLIRPGASGLSKLRKELTGDQIVSVFKTACKLSKVF